MDKTKGGGQGWDVGMAGVRGSSEGKWRQLYLNNNKKNRTLKNYFNTSNLDFLKIWTRNNSTHFSIDKTLKFPHH